MLISVGVCAFRKSGNYLLFRILKSIYGQCGGWSSYNQWSRCWAGCFAPEDMAYPEEEEVDEVIVEDGTLVLYKGHHRIPCDASARSLDEYNRKARMVLTHEEPDLLHFDLLGRNRKWIYLVRDGRAAINSLLHFLVTPALLKRHPEYSIRSADKLYDYPGYFKRHVTMWRDHIEAYKRLRGRYLLVKYEDLTTSKEEEMRRILNYLEIERPIDLGSIVKETEFTVMKRKAPVHVRKGSPRDWEQHFQSEHRRVFREIAGALLQELGYVTDCNW